MNASHQALFQWISSVYAAAPWSLGFARATAVGGAWVSAGLVAWALWRRPTESLYVLTTIVASGLATLLAHVLAKTLGWERPFVQGLSPAYIAHSASGSLPSAHAAAMFTVALMFRARPALRHGGAVLAALALATGIARVFVGVHFPMDIGAGFVLAYCVAAVVGALFPWVNRFVGHTRMAGSSRAALRAGQTLPGQTP